MGIARELAEALGVRFVTTDLPEEALWIEEYSLLIIDQSLTSSRALAYLGDVLLRD